MSGIILVIDASKYTYLDLYTLHHQVTHDPRCLHRWLEFLRVVPREGVQADSNVSDDLNQAYNC